MIVRIRRNQFSQINANDEDGNCNCVLYLWQVSHDLFVREAPFPFVAPFTVQNLLATPGCNNINSCINLVQSRVGCHLELEQVLPKNELCPNSTSIPRG